MGRERKICSNRSVEEVVEGRPDGARAAPHARYAQPMAGAFATGEVAALGAVRRYGLKPYGKKGKTSFERLPFGHMGRVVPSTVITVSVTLSDPCPRTTIHDPRHEARGRGRVCVSHGLTR